MRKSQHPFLALIFALLFTINAPSDSLAQSNDAVYTLVDQQPSYPGGMAALFGYLKSEMKYPEAALESGVEGRVFLEFVVEKDGSLSNVNVIKGIGFGCDQEAARLFADCKTWTAGRIKGQPVRVKMVLPLQFKLPK